MSESKATVTPQRRKLPRGNHQTNPSLSPAPPEHGGEGEASVRVAIYARVSTLDQKCEMQLRDLRQYAAARGWTLAGEYVDNGYSGKNTNRPELKRCVADAKARKFDAIAVWKLDRLSRNPVHRDHARYRHRFEQPHLTAASAYNGRVCRV